MGWGAEPMAKKKFFRHPWCKMGVSLKHRNRTYGQKEPLRRGCEGWPTIYLGVGGSKEKKDFKKIFLC